jgi:hypothetical protein
LASCANREGEDAFRRPVLRHDGTEGTWAEVSTPATGTMLSIWGGPGNLYADQGSIWHGTR